MSETIKYRKKYKLGQNEKKYFFVAKLFIQ